MVTFTGLVVGFLFLVAVFFAFGEASGEDRSDDIVILQWKGKRRSLGYGDGRAKVVHRGLNIPLLSMTRLKVT